MRGALTAALIFLAAALPAAALGDDAIPLLDFIGETVIDVSFDGHDLPEDEFLAMVPVFRKSPLRASDVREGIRNLYRTGLYDGISVTGRSVQGGVEIKFYLTPKKWIREVRFKGNLRLSNRNLSRRVNLSRAEELTAERLEENRQKLMDHYNYRGFSDARIAYMTQVGQDQKTDVIFDILEGPKSRITQVRLSGDTGWSNFKLSSLIASMPGEMHDGRTLDRDVERIIRKLKKGGYFYPEVRYSLGPDPEIENGVVVTFHVERGVKYLLGVEVDSEEYGARTFLKWIRKAYIDEPDEDEARKTSSEKVMKRVLDDGYPFASLEWVEGDQTPGAREVDLFVTTGWMAKFGTVTIDGADALSPDEIQEALDFERQDPFVRTRLNAGVEGLKTAYRNRGYLSTEVLLKPLQFNEEDGFRSVPIHFTVHEGERTMIHDISIGESIYPTSETLEILGVKAGDPYVPEKVAAGRDALLDRFARDGYLYGSVSLKEPAVNQDGSVNLEFDIESGPQVYLGSIIIIGGKNVKNRIIRLAMGLERGDLLTMEKITEARRRVYRLGVHDTVDVQLMNQEISAGTKDLVVEVTERRKRVVGFKVGYGSEDRFRGQVSYTNRNVAGMARTITLGARASSIEQQLSLIYGHPYFLSRPIDLTAALSDLREQRESFSQDTQSITLRFDRKVTKKITGIADYTFEGVDIFDIAPGAILSPEDIGKTDVAAAGLEGWYETRDDFLDPTMGILGRVRLEAASRYLGSKAEDFSLEMSVRKYFPLSGKVVLAALARGGIILPYGNSEQVIITRRFFLGGMNSVRGYDLDELGPKDDEGNPVGGNYLINLDAELRYPVYRWLKGVIFIDSGSVWLNEEPYTDSTLRASAGAGIRMTTPAGPLSLDYGYKLNPATDTESKWRIHFSIGHAF